MGTIIRKITASVKVSNWKDEINKFDNKARAEEFRNELAMKEARKDLLRDCLYVTNTLSGDPQLERELKSWRKALTDLRRL